MAAPTVSARVLPNAPFMKEGFRVQLSFGLAPNFCLWEIDIKPPDIDGQEEIDTTTQFNAGGLVSGAVLTPPLRTFYPRAVAKLSNVEGMYAYPSKAYEDVWLVLNVLQSITIHFPNGDQLVFWGHLKAFKPEALKEGDFPKANCAIVVDNWDPANNVQAVPIFLPISGT